MSYPSLSWLYGAGALLVLGLAAMTYLVLVSHDSPFWRVLRRYEARLDHHAGFLLIPYGGSQIARVQVVVCCVLLAAALVLRTPVVGIVAALVAVLPPVLLAKQHQARVAKLKEQLDTWLLLLANALKATPSIGEAIESTLTLVPNPFREEIDLLSKEVRLGTPVDRAVNHMAQRADNAVVSSALSTIVVARQTGGDLPAILEKSAATLRESTRLEGVIRAKTAEGRAQVLALAVIPFGLGIAMSWLDPNWFEPMWQQSIGKLILGGAVVTWAAALLWARRIVQIEP